MIKTWNERCQTHPDHQTGMVSHQMIALRMQEEIDDLRAALAQPERKPMTNREMYELCPAVLMPARGAYEFALGLAKFARAIEKAHGIGGEE